MGRSLFIVASLVLHGLVAAAAFRAPPKTRTVKRPTRVAVVRAKKPEPPPDAPAAAPAPVKRARPAATPSSTPAPAARRPVETGLVLSNLAPTPPGAGPPGLRVAALSANERAPVVERAIVESAAAACDEPPQKPQVLSRARDIEYTDEARTAGLEGRLVLRVTVDADGSVSEVEVVSGIEPAFDAAAVAAVRSWRFQPGLRCGEPVDGATYTLARRFELGD